MNNVTKFCRDRHVSMHLEDAFFAYIRSTYAVKYELKNGETMKFAVGHLNETEVDEAWTDFVRDFRNYLAQK